MDGVETSGCSHFGEEASRYAWGDLAADRRTVVEAHLRECVPCREFVQFVQDLITAVRQDPLRSHPVEEPCPDASQIVDLEADTLDDVTAKHVTGHVMYCKTCRDAYLLLRRSSGEGFEESILKRADTEELERREWAIRELLTRIEQVRTILSSEQAPKEEARRETRREMLARVFNQATGLMQDIERTFARTVEYADIDSDQMAHSLLDRLLEIEKAYIELLYEFAPLDVISELRRRHAEGLERAFMSQALERTGGDKAKAARSLGIDRIATLGPDMTRRKPIDKKN